MPMRVGGMEFIMKNPNELKRFLFFQINECEAFKEYLEEMALKGWKLKCFKTYFCFEKIEPQKLYYAVEIFSKASTFDTVPTASTNEYIDYCREAGWDFICNVGQINIFVSDTKNAIPIETDEALKLKTITKGILKQHASFWFFLFPMFLLDAAMSFLNFESLATMNINLIAFLFYIIFFVVVIFQVVRFTVWTAKQKRRIKNGEPIKHISRKDQKRKEKIRLILLSVILIFFLFISVGAFLQKDYMLAGTILFSLLLISVISLLGHFLLLFGQLIQKDNFRTTANKLISVVIGIIISFVAVGLGAILFIFAGLLEEPPSGNFVSSSKTFLASMETYRVELDDDEKTNFPDSENPEDPEEGALIFTWGDDTDYCYFYVFKSNYSFIIEQYLYSKKHILFRKDYTEINMPEWDAKTVFMTHTGGRIYVVYDDYVVSFYSDEPFTKAIVAPIIRP